MIKGGLFIENNKTIMKSATVCGSTLLTPFSTQSSSYIHIRLLCSSALPSYTINCVMESMVFISDYEHPLLPHHTGVCFRKELWKCRLCYSDGVRFAPNPGGKGRVLFVTPDQTLFPSGAVYPNSRLVGHSYPLF